MFAAAIRRAGATSLHAPCSSGAVRGAWAAGAGSVSRFDHIAGVPAGALPSGTPTSLHGVPARWRSRKGTPSWYKRAARKRDAAEVRAVTEFALRYDPLRVAKDNMLRVAKDLGWPLVRNQVITEGLSAFAAVEHMFLVLDMVPADAYFPGTTVLLPSVQEQYDLMRRKGWKVVVVSQRAWERAGTKGGVAKVNRAQLLVNLIAQQAPFEPRRDVVPVSMRDYGVYDVMKHQAEKHRSQFGIGGRLRGVGRVRMRSRRNRQ